MVWVWNHKPLSQAVPFFHTCIFKWKICLSAGLTLLGLIHQAHTTGNSQTCVQIQHHGGLVFSHLLTRMAKSCYSYPRLRVSQICICKSLVTSCESWKLNELSTSTHLLLLETGRNEVLWRIKLGRQKSLRTSKETDEVAEEKARLLKCYTSIQLCFYPITHRIRLEDSEDHLSTGEVETWMPWVSDQSVGQKQRDSGPVRDHFLNNKDRDWRHLPTYMHTHTCMHKHKHMKKSKKIPE